MCKANLQSLEKSVPVISDVDFVHKNGISSLPKHPNCKCAMKWSDTAIADASKHYSAMGFFPHACVVFA